MVKHSGRFIVEAHPSRYIKELVVPLSQCSNLTELSISIADISDETAIMMRPLLERLQMLSMGFCDGGPLLWKMLPLWCVELRFLQLIFNYPVFNETLIAEYNRHSSRLQYSFRKLVKISVAISGRCSNRVLAYLVKCNPQLREIIFEIAYSIDVYDQILELMPRLEALTVKYDSRTQTDLQAHGATIARLRNLKSFTAIGAAANLRQIIRSLEESETPLEYLHLELGNSNITEEFFGNILKLNHLKQFKLEGTRREWYKKYVVRRIEDECSFFHLKKLNAREFGMELGGQGHEAAREIANQVCSRFNVFFGMKKRY